MRKTEQWNWHPWYRLNKILCLKENGIGNVPQHDHAWFVLACVHLKIFIVTLHGNIPMSVSLRAEYQPDMQYQPRHCNLIFCLSISFIKVSSLNVFCFSFRWAALPLQPVWSLLQRVWGSDATPEVHHSMHREDSLQPVQGDTCRERWCTERCRKATSHLLITWIAFKKYLSDWLRVGGDAIHGYVCAII